MGSRDPDNFPARPAGRRPGVRRRLARVIGHPCGGPGPRADRGGHFTPLGRGAPRIVPVPALIARGVLWTVGTLAYLAGRATLLSADKSNEYLAPAWTCRSDALTRDTGWQAQIDLETGLRRAANWYREVGWL